MPILTGRKECRGTLSHINNHHLILVFNYANIIMCVTIIKIPKRFKIVHMHGGVWFPV